MNKSKIIKALKNRNEVHSINGWKIAYNASGKVWVAEKGTQRVIRSSEAILANIVMKG